MKRSKQRDAILDVLCSTDTHPTADQIYDEVRKVMPNISHGTVYRNLNLLAENNEIIKIGVIGEQCRYDGRISPHNHFVCKCCGSVLDVNMDYDYSINEKAEQCISGDIEYHDLTFYGYCEKCLNNAKK